MKPRKDLEDDIQARASDCGGNAMCERFPDHPAVHFMDHPFVDGIVGSAFHRFGRVSPLAAQNVRDGHGSHIGMILHGGSCRIASESTTPSREKRIPVLRHHGSLPMEASAIGHKASPSTPIKEHSPVRISSRHASDRLAQTSLPLILEGETGTGKEFLARMIHENGPRQKGPFVVLDATHFSNEIADTLLFGHRKGTFTGAVGDQKGRLESSDKGTLFIDELQNMSLAIQMKLLRFLDRKTLQPLGSSTEIAIDTRILVATNEPLSSLLASGRLRPDFFYRIRGKTIRIPPLREQIEEIPSLIEWKWKKWLEENKAHPPIISADGVKTLQSYPWPGNIRELFSFLDYLLGSFLPHEKVPVAWIKDELRSIQLDLSGDGYPDRLENLAIERELIVQSLRSSEGEIAKASELMGMSRTTLWRKMKKLGIRPFEGS